MTAALTFFIAALLCLQHVVEYCHAPARAAVGPHRPAGGGAAAAAPDLAGGIAGFRGLCRGRYPRPGGPLFQGPGAGPAGLLDRGPGALPGPDRPAPDTGGA